MSSRAARQISQMPESNRLGLEHMWHVTCDMPDVAMGLPAQGRCHWQCQGESIEPCAHLAHLAHLAQVAWAFWKRAGPAESGSIANHREWRGESREFDFLMGKWGWGGVDDSATGRLGPAGRGVPKEGRVRSAARAETQCRNSRQGLILATLCGH